MTLLEEIDKMKKEGLSDSQISRRLREEGVSPKEIDEALEQGQVKSAVSNYEDLPEPAAPYPTFETEIANHPQEDLQEPAIALGNAPYPEDYSEEEYGGYPQYQYQEPLDTEMISEITEQILEEKTKEMQKDLSEFAKFRIEIQGKVDNIEDRLKRIERTIDKLQTSIIGTMGSYGKNISDLKKEMETTQESFSKVINPLAENLKELRKIAKGNTKKAAKKTAKKL